MNNRAKILIAAAISLFAAAYFGSPYYAVHDLRQAALAGDADALEDGVDFPSVQSSLKSQMTIALTNKMQNDPELKNNPFAGLGMAMMPAIIDKAVTSYVTADGIAMMVKGRKPGSEPTAAGESDLDYSSDWSGLDRFRMRTVKKSTGEEGPTFVFKRRGLFGWKLEKIELPEAFFNKS